jgi:hypothetical protein
LTFRRFGADPERNRYLAHAHASVGLAKQPPDAVEYPSALSVELVGTDSVDRHAYTFLGDLLWRRQILQLSECQLITSGKSDALYR